MTGGAGGTDGLPPGDGPGWAPWPGPQEPPRETRTWSGAERAAWVAVLVTVVPPVVLLVLAAVQWGCTGEFPRCEWSIPAAVFMVFAAVVVAVPTIALLLAFGRPRFATPGRPLPAVYVWLAWAQLGLEALAWPSERSPQGVAPLAFVLLVVLAFATPITVSAAGRRSAASR